MNVTFDLQFLYSRLCTQPKLQLIWLRFCRNSKQCNRVSVNIPAVPEPTTNLFFLGIN